VVEAWPLLSFDFLTQKPDGRDAKGGVWSALLGTIYLVSTSLLIAAPVGVLAAVYLNEYAKQGWLTRIINLAVVNLAGVPSIVHALFGLGAFVLFAGIGRSILAASLTLAIMTLPVIIASTKEALASVPMSFREACWNVGATRWQTIKGIVLPNSISGILTGVILQVSRSAAKRPRSCSRARSSSSASRGRPLRVQPDGSVHGALDAPLHDHDAGEDAPKALPYATAVTLLGTVLLVNAVAIALRVKLARRKKW
jgi:phosphate transport system permease protein